MIGDSAVRTVIAFVILVIVVAVSVGGEASPPAEIAEASNPDETAAALTERAAAHISKGEYQKALPLLQRALEIREKELGPEHPATATSLNNLAMLYDAMGNYQKALPLLQRALKIREKQLGPEHPDTAISLNNLAALYVNMGDYPKALPLYQRALEINEKQLGPEHPATALSLNNLAFVYAGWETTRRPCRFWNGPWRSTKSSWGQSILPPLLLSTT
jgi:tetratricopeptide (TPR) repeat protein